MGAFLIPSHPRPWRLGFLMRTRFLDSYLTFVKDGKLVI